MEGGGAARVEGDWGVAGEGAGGAVRVYRAENGGGVGAERGGSGGVGVGESGVFAGGGGQGMADLCYGW